MCPILFQYKAPAHIKQGSRVTYKVASGKYFACKFSQALVIAKISACAVTSFKSCT